MLGDGDHGHELSGATGDHLGTVVRHRQHHRRDPVIEIRVDPLGELLGTLERGFEEALLFESIGERGLDLSSGLL